MLKDIFNELNNKNVLITGGAAGIGACLAKNYLSLGSNVYVLDKSSESINEFKIQTKEYETKLHCYNVDLANIEELNQIIDSIILKIDSLFVLINNAADDLRHNIDEIDESLWTELVDSNLKHYVLMIRYLKDSLAKSHGSIINIASNSYGLGIDGYPLYVMCKGGITGITRGMARELAKSQVRINTILPGWVMTERQKKQWATPQAIDECLSQQAIKTLMKPEDILGACLFLSTSMSTMITGQSIVVDGGRYFS